MRPLPPLLSRLGASVLSLLVFAACGSSGGDPGAGGSAAQGGAGAGSCVPNERDCAELRLSPGAYPTVLAEDALRTHVTGYGIESPQFTARLDVAMERHRMGTVLMEAMTFLRTVTPESSGEYGPQLTTVLAPLVSHIETVTAAGGRVQLGVFCATPIWLAEHPYPHDIFSGVEEPTNQPTSACSAPSDLETWRAIMRGVGDVLAPYADAVEVTIGNEPDNYFVGTQGELFAWYEATARGLLASSGGGSYRIGGLTFVGHKEATLMRAYPTLDNSTVSFAAEQHEEPITKSWIAFCAEQGLPLHNVTLHQFGGSPIPSSGTYWAHARRDITAWLEESGYVGSEVSLAINDFPQWAPFESNDTEYLAAHVASSLLSMLDLSLREGEPVWASQSFLFDWGFRPDGDFPAGFSGVPGMTNERWLIEPIYNMNSLVAQLDGELVAVDSSDPFVSAVAAVDGNHLGVMLVNHVPLERQVDLLYDYYEHFPILSNFFTAEDLSALGYSLDSLLADVVAAYFDGVAPSQQELFDALFDEVSPIDFEALSWPEALKEAWRQAQWTGRSARAKRAAATTASLDLGMLADGDYVVEHFIVDADHGNPYRDRHALEERLSAAEAMGPSALQSEVLAINEEYDTIGLAVSNELTLTAAREPLGVVMKPNSVHLLRFRPAP
jgi:hypothetical protein